MAPAATPQIAAARPHVAQPAFVFASPLCGFAVNSPFGLRKMPWEEGGRLHEGVDIAAPAGTPVRVTLAGTVVRSGTDGGYGRFIEVRHEGGLTSLYGHLGRHAKGLKPGSPVPAGSVVGYVGSTGRSTGAHLHFEIRRDGRPLNPTLFMGQSFMTHADLPLTAAARVPRRVRIAQVASWPASVKRQAEALATPVAQVLVAERKPDGRIRAVISPSTGSVAPQAAPQALPAPPPAPQPSKAYSALAAAQDASDIVTTAND